MCQCPCGSVTYASCCEPYHSGVKPSLTPRRLMMSRYSAYALANINYIKSTMCGKALVGFDESQAREWATSVIWVDLKVIKDWSDSPSVGFVAFEARYIENNKLHTLCEVSEFHRMNGHWYYVDGEHTVKKSVKKIAKNSACPCSSGKKFKNCHNKSNFFIEGEA